MTYNVLMGTLNPTHSVTHSLTASIRRPFGCLSKVIHVTR